ncbi:ABC transporter ATP-binding protein [Sphingomonas nostoxanthinifaciens]|uniref:ABC transporter ATP-binding protein n=1 Tax=Sphingomonas nostoxanthinifaciens TaxID=2872652 RepID=UPI001CC1FE13|nr:ABC transporter ATP-binding protein [Sphingomonas nostoxanthinifaciens]UAK24570.1 ABC transporter ATP-binding protein [Sphingomonas nostoxanthinifaciens]
MVTIALEGLDVALGGRRVVEGATATLTGGALIGIVGPNGAGKSTLLRAMLGLIAPAAGQATIDGRPLPNWPRRDLARILAYLPQGQTLHWPMTVARLVALGRLPHLAPLSRLAEADAAAVETALARADALALRDRIATELSGGERARVLLARALAVGAPALLADEPLAALDPGHQLDVMALLAEEARGGGLVVAVLHDLTLAARFCDRLLLMDRGRIVADGTPRDVLTPERLAQVYCIRAAIVETDEGPAILPLARAPR